MGTASRRRPTSLSPTLIAGISTAAQEHPSYYPSSPDADDFESTPLLPRRRHGASATKCPGTASRGATAQAVVLTQPPLQRAPHRAAPHQAAAAKTRKVRWHEMAFGSVRVPAAMDMGEIRMRLQAPRRDTQPEAPALWAPWRLIRSLSCKGVEAVAVAAASAPIRLA